MENFPQLPNNESPSTEKKAGFVERVKRAARTLGIASATAATFYATEKPKESGTDIFEQKKERLYDSPKLDLGLSESTVVAAETTDTLEGKKDATRNIFLQDLTPSEIAAREQTIAAHLSDHTDIAERSIDRKRFLEEYEYTEKRLKNLIDLEKEQVDKLLRIKEPPDHALAYIEKLKVSIATNERQLQHLLTNKEQTIESKLAENREYLAKRDSLKTAELLKVFNEYDKQKQYLEDQLMSEEYLKRLTKEFGDEKKAITERNKRLDRLKTDYVLESSQKIFEDVPNARAYYDGKIVHLPITGKELDVLGIHEFQHQATKTKKGMSSHADKLYTESYDARGLPEYGLEQDQELDEYYRSAIERDPRKKVLEFEMEKFEIKNYGEKFTREHYKQLLKLKKENKLSSDSIEFLNMTKPEHIEEIINSIAVIDEKESSDV